MRRLLKEVFGTAGQIDDPPLTGITDVQYIAEALSSEGFTRSDIDARPTIQRLGERVQYAYIEEPKTAQTILSHPK